MVLGDNKGRKKGRRAADRPNFPYSMCAFSPRHLVILIFCYRQDSKHVYSEKWGGDIYRFVHCAASWMEGH